MPDRVVLPPKRQADLILYSQFDFLSTFASATDAISSIASVVASVYTGIDANPTAIVNSFSFSGSVASVLVQSGVVGVIYELAVTAILTSGQRPVLCGYLAVIPDLP